MLTLLVDRLLNRLVDKQPQSFVLPPRLRSALDAQLKGHERVVWVGRPIPQLYVMRAARNVYGAIVSLIFMICWFVMVYVQDGDAFLFLCGFLLLGIQLWSLHEPFDMRRRAADTAYVITTERAIVFGGVYSRALPELPVEVDSFGPERLTNVFRIEQPDGSGDLVLERREWEDEGTTRYSDQGFLGIAHVKDVEELLRKLTGPRVNVT